MISKIIPGFGRGSRDLGIPTANISRDDLQCHVDFDALPCGIYWGFARIVDFANDSHTHKLHLERDPDTIFLLQQVHKTAISIGYNPCYSNTFKTIEPHLIAPSTTTTKPDTLEKIQKEESDDDNNKKNNPFRYASSCQETLYPDLYGCTITLSVVGFLRPELPFETLDKLILAIKEDISKTEILCDGFDEHVILEKQWVQSHVSSLLL